MESIDHLTIDERRAQVEARLASESPQLIILALTVQVLATVRLLAGKSLDGLDIVPETERQLRAAFDARVAEDGGRERLEAWVAQLRGPIELPDGNVFARRRKARRLLEVIHACGPEVPGAQAAPGAKG